MLQGSYAAGVHLWVSAAQANQYILLYHGNSANSDLLQGSMYVPVQHKPSSNLCAIPASYKAAAVDNRGPATGVCAAGFHLYVTAVQANEQLLTCCLCKTAKSDYYPNRDVL